MSVNMVNVFSPSQKCPLYIYKFQHMSYVVGDEGFHGLISTDEGYITELALLPSFIDHRVAACRKLSVWYVVLHLL